MKHISIDFSSKVIYITTDGRIDKKEKVNLDKKDFYNFIPSKYRDYNLFTWNFQNETFSVNQDDKKIDELYKPQFIIPLNGLKKRYKEFMSLIGEEIETASKIMKLLRF